MTDTMLADATQVTGVDLDYSSMLGEWVNCRDGSDHLTGITVSEKDGKLLLRPRTSVEWPEIPATPYAFSGQSVAGGLHAVYEADGVRTELAGNEKFGVLVIQSYTSFHDGSGRMPHYARQFFHRKTTGPLTGVWYNTNQGTEWITGFTWTDDVLQVSAASDPTDWGTAKTTSYTDNLSEPAFYAEYKLDAFDAVLVANTNQGLIIITAFLNFKDGRQNYLCREFFVRA